MTAACIGTWHIHGTPFDSKSSATATATAEIMLEIGTKWRIVPRRSLWVIQVFRVSS